MQIADFGLSRVLGGPRTPHSLAWGTAHYMAPEHFHGDITSACDVYSFGVILWEMAHGTRVHADLSQGESAASMQPSM